MAGKVLFIIPDRQKANFLTIISEYYKYVVKQADNLCTLSAIEAYENLIRGRSIDGKADLSPVLKFFDEVVEKQTKGFYTPSEIQRYRYEKNKRATSKRYKENTEKSTSEFTKEELKKVDKIKSTLLSEYPNLNRRDLDESIDNYCKLNVKINSLMETDIIVNNIAIKNLSDTMIKLGGYLGIDESQKAKQKAVKDKQSVAALAEEFQKMIEEFPEIVDRMKYKELRILIEKVDRQELSKILFELSQYAGMTIIEARQFVAERESAYEAH